MEGPSSTLKQRLFASADGFGVLGGFWGVGPRDLGITIGSYGGVQAGKQLEVKSAEPVRTEVQSS